MGKFGSKNNLFSIFLYFICTSTFYKHSPYVFQENLKTEKDTIPFLKTFFETLVGPVLAIYLPIDTFSIKNKKNKSYCFITFQEIKDAQKAFQSVKAQYIPYEQVYESQQNNNTKQWKCLLK